MSLILSHVIQGGIFHTYDRLEAVGVKRGHFKVTRQQQNINELSLTGSASKRDINDQFQVFYLFHLHFQNMTLSQ